MGFYLDISWESMVKNWEKFANVLNGWFRTVTRIGQWYLLSSDERRGFVSETFAWSVSLVRPLDLAVYSSYYVVPFFSCSCSLHHNLSLKSHQPKVCFVQNDKVFTQMIMISIKLNMNKMMTFWWRLNRSWRISTTPNTTKFFFDHF